MVKIDLITGFLGSGKTTFIKMYAEFLLKKGYKIGILENDFGAVNVDMMILQKLAGENCELEMISGACDKDCHKRRFKTKLISMAMRGFDRIIVEPSGIYDIDEFFDTLHEPPLDNWYEPGNVITIVDGAMGAMDTDLSGSADFIASAQIACGGKIILSKCGQASADEIENTVNYLIQRGEKCHCGKDFKKRIIKKDWNEFTDKDFEEISTCGYNSDSYLDEITRRSIDSGNFQSVYFMNKKIPFEELEKKLKKMLADQTCGKIFRIKGFVLNKDNKWFQINCTKKNFTFEPIENGQEVFIVIGENLNKDIIENYFE